MARGRKLLDPRRTRPDSNGQPADSKGGIIPLPIGTHR